MRASRGMGAMNPVKIKAIKKRDGNEPVKLYKKGGCTCSHPPTSKKIK